MPEPVQSFPSTDPFDDLDAPLRRDIDQLIDQGCLSEGFTFGGHTFVIKTLNAAEANATALAMQQYQGSLREVNAWMQATVGLCLVSLDGDAEFHKRIGDLNTHAAKRFEWAGQLDDVILSFVYTRYNQLDQRRIAARQAVANLQMPGQPDSTPWPASSTEPGTFSVGAPMESPYSPR
jgi:hypothetical protein